MALPPIHTLWWELQANRITPWTLPPMEAVPHVFTTNDDKLVWMAKTKAFIEVATLHYSEINVDHSVDLGSSVTVLVKGSPDIVDPPFFCVAISMDHTFSSPMMTRQCGWLRPKPSLRLRGAPADQAQIPWISN